MPVIHRKRSFVGPVWHIYFTESETERIRDDASEMTKIIADAVDRADVNGLPFFTSALVHISGYGLRIHAGNCLTRGNRLKIIGTAVPPWVIPSEYIPGSEEYGIRTPY